MNQESLVLPSSDVLLQAMRQLRAGICIYDASHRIVFINHAHEASVNAPPGTLRSGLDLESSLRLLAYHGAFGPGDPERQVAERLALDHTRPHHRRRHLADGRVFELFIDPMPAGGFVITSIDVTPMTHDERAARERAMLVEKALSLLRPGVILFGADRRLMLANPSAEEMYGLAVGNLKPGLEFETFIRRLAASGEFAAGDTEAHVAATLAWDRTKSRRFQRTRPNGTVILATSDPMPGGGFVLTDTDITALARAEDEARRRATLLDGILASMPHGICVYGPDRRVTMLNPAYTAIMKGAPVAVGDHLFEVIRRRAAVGEYGPGRPSDVERQQFTYDISRPQARRRVRPNGTAIDIRTAPLPDGGHVSVVTDITPMVQAETEATQRASVLAAMLASIRHGIVLFGPDKRILAANPIAADLLGVSVEALRPGTHQHTLLAETMRGGGFGEGEAAHAFLEEIEARDITRSYRHERSTPDGRILEIRCDPTADGGFVVTYADVTADRLQAAALREARDAAEAASQAKSRFLATMSHELRTPLNAVIGFSDALAGLATRPDPGQIAEFAQAINDAGRHLLALINDILDVARIEAGRFDLSADRIELARVVAACLRIVGPQAQVAGVTINTDLAPYVPVLIADERRLRQVLLNLLSNAIKFTPAGGTITVAASLDADALHIRVRDTGIGLPVAQLERVFEPFTQLDASLSRRFQGSGLGLYLSRALVAAHGGTLHLESNEGEGTTAVLSLPRHRLLTPSPAAREPDERTHRH